MSVPTVAPPKLRVVKDWHWLLTRSWSLRFVILAAVLSGIEVGLSFFTDSPPLPRGVFALLSSIVTVMAFGARFLAQRDES